MSDYFCVWKQNLFLISFHNIHLEKIICIFLKGGILHKKEHVNIILNNIVHIKIIHLK